MSKHLHWSELVKIIEQAAKEGGPNLVFERMTALNPPMHEYQKVLTWLVAKLIAERK